MSLKQALSKTVIIAVGLAALAYCHPALAEWGATTDGPDVFGVTKVVALNKDIEHGLIVQCDDKDAMSIAYLIEKKKFDDITSLPATLIIQADHATPIHLAAELKSWNDNYAAIAAEGRSAEAAAVIRAIQSATSKINVGIQIGEAQESASFDTEGSTSAMTTVVKGCKFASSTKSF